MKTKNLKSDSIGLKLKIGEYRPAEIEPKWQRIWEEKDVFSPDLDSTSGKQYYNLMMFPYPSAEGLHVGNMYAFTGADVWGRFMRMRGYEVFQPIGLDGFGIHSENYALKVGEHPKSLSQKTEKRFYSQLRATGNAYDWKRILETYDPDYYKWTQWLFIQMFKHGLAYRKKAKVNWCPSCKTVLADEQVISGECERCGTQVEKRELEQWFFRITSYADRLLKGIEKIDWTEKVKIAQREWIGRKEGINIAYPVINAKGEKVGVVSCFTTRPDTNFGATFVVVAPEHSLMEEILNQVQDDKKEEMRRYVEQAKKITEIERVAQGRKKTGVFTGLYCINQLNNYKMPLFISDFVLMSVGTGAVVGVPGHDKRDFEFAKALDLPVTRVVVGRDGDKSEIIQIDQVQEEEGTMINSDFLDGLDIHEAIKKMMDYLEEKGWGEREVVYHLRDWLISRQRYWGPPIPMIFCQKCAGEGKSWLDTEEAKEYKALNPKHEIRNKSQVQNSNSPNNLEFRISDFGFASPPAGWYPVPESELPVELPYIENYQPKGIRSTGPEQVGESPLAQDREWVSVKCPNCRAEARRETDVSDTFLDSSWYFLRYLATEIDWAAFPSEAFANPKFEARNSKQIQNSKFQTAKQFRISDFDIRAFARRGQWLPVNMYIGGAEHSVLHLLYVRFVTMALHDFGYLEFEEPFPRFFAHGLIIKDGAKMSKSKGNVVVPDAYIQKYGADTLRTYLMFLGPFNQGGDFRDAGVEGMHRFLRRVWKLVVDGCYPELGSGSQKMPKQVRHDMERKRRMNKAIKEVTDDIENLRYNTAIAHLMEWYNYLSSKFKVKSEKLTREEAETFLKLFAPFAPHMTEELWQRLQRSQNHAESYAEKRRKVSAIQRSVQQSSAFYSIHLQPWSSYDPKFLQEEEVTIAVQVDGKTRDTIKVPAKGWSASGPDSIGAGGKSEKLKVKGHVEELAKKSSRVLKYVHNKNIVKTVYIEGKIINFVTA